MLKCFKSQNKIINLILIVLLNPFPIIVIKFVAFINQFFLYISKIIELNCVRFLLEFRKVDNYSIVVYAVALANVLSDNLSN